MANIRSAFPLDEGAIARRTLGRILTDPISWAPLLPAVAAYTIFDAPVALALAVLAVVLCGIGMYWRGQWDRITHTLRQQVIAEHNQAQDALLKASADELNKDGERALALKLEQFLSLKRQGETRIRENGALTFQKIQLEQLIDSLCFGVRDQLQAIVMKEKSGEPMDRQVTMQQVDAAFATLQSTIAELGTILDPAAGTAGAASDSIEEITRRLREETEIARRIQARLRVGENAQAPVDPPQLEGN